MRRYIQFVMLTLLLAACGTIAAEGREPALVRQFRNDLGEFDFSQGVLCIGNPVVGGNEALVAAYNPALLTATANLLAAPQAQTLPAAVVAAIVAEGGGTPVRIADERDGFILAEVTLRRCRFGSHDTRVLIPTIVVFDRNGDFWVTEAGTIPENPEWADGRWFFMSEWLNPDAGRPNTTRMLHIARNADGQWGGIAPPVASGPVLTWSGSGAGWTIEYVDDFRKLRVTAFGEDPQTTQGAPPCALDLGENSFYTNTFYEGTMTLLWDGNAYHLTEETPFEARIVGNRGGEILTTTDWRGYCD